MIDKPKRFSKLKETAYLKYNNFYFGYVEFCNMEWIYASIGYKSHRCYTILREINQYLEKTISTEGKCVLNKLSIIRILKKNGKLS